MAKEADEDAGRRPALLSEAAPMIDEVAESAFIAEARERGEPMATPRASRAMAEEVDSGPLPALDELVQKIPAEIRAALDDLFRVKFTKVTRVRERDLKG